MGRYISNGIAFVRGLFTGIVSKLFVNWKVAFKIRIFPSANLDFDRCSIVTIENNAKVRERALLSVRNGAELIISSNVSVGMDCKIVAHNKVTIGEGTLLSPNVLIYDHNHLFDNENGVYRKEFNSAQITIGKNCWIGANTVILKGTTIGNNCVVGAGCVISGSYPDNSLIVQKRATEVITIGN